LSGAGRARTLGSKNHCATHSVTSPPRTKNTEFVTLRVSENDPRLGPLTHIGVCRPESDKALDLGILVVGPEVEMKPILTRFDLRHRNEKKSGKPISTRSYLKLVGLVVDYNPAQRLLPPPAEPDRVFRVNVCLLPFQSHAMSIREEAPRKAGVLDGSQVSQTTWRAFDSG
jgi:hypothetical protein